MAVPEPKLLRRAKSFPQSDREAPQESAASSVDQLIIRRELVLRPLVRRVTQSIVVVTPQPEVNNVAQIEGSNPRSDRIGVENYGLQRKKMAEFSIIAVEVSGMLLVAFSMDRQELEGRVNQLQLFISVLLTISALSSGIALFCCWRSRCAINLLFITCALLIHAAASYLALLHKYYLLLLLPAYLILGASCYWIIRTARSDPTTEEYGSIKADLKKSFGLSSAAFSVSFSGLLTFVIAFLKSPSGADARGKRLLDNACAMVLFLECILAIGLVLLSCSLPKPEDQNERASLHKSKILKAFAFVQWLTLHSMAATVSCQLFGGGHVALVAVGLVPIFCVWVCSAVYCGSFTMRGHNVQQTSAIDTAVDCKQHLKFLSSWAKVVGSCSFSSLLAVFASLGGGGGGGGSAVLKICVAALNYSFSLSISMMVLLFEAPKNESLITVIGILRHCSAFLFVLAAVMIVALIIV